MILRHMRKGIFSALFLGLLVLGGVGLILTDWNGMFRTGVTNTDVAKIDGTPIKIAEFDRQVRRILRAQHIETTQAYQVGMIDNILQGEVLSRLLVRSSRDLGLIVDDSYVAERIKKLIAPYAGESGDSKAALSRFLQMQGMGEPELVKIIRDEISTSLLRTTLSQAAYVPSALAADMDSYKNEHRAVEVLTLPNSAAKLPAEPDNKALADYYEGIKGQYIVPEKRSFTVALMSTEDMSKGVTVTDDDIKAAYEDNLESYKSAEQRILQQAVLDSESKAKDVLSKVKSGKPLSEAVKLVTGKSQAYTGENSFVKSGLMKEIADPVFAAKAGDTVGPIKTPLGFHVLVVKTITPEMVQPLDTVKDKIHKDLVQSKASDQIYAVTSKLDDRLAGGETLENLAKEYKLQLITVKDVSKDTKNIKDLKPVEASEASIVTSAFATPDGETSALSDLPDGRMFAVRTDEIKVSRTKDLKETLSDVRERWTQEEKARINLANAQKLIEDLNKDSASASKKLADYAGKNGVRVQTFPAIARGSETKGLEASAVARLMASDKNQFVVSGSPDGVTIGRVLSITLPDNKTTPPAKSITDGLATDIQQDNLMLYMGKLQSLYNVSYNRALLKRNYGGNAEEGAADTQ